MSGEGRVVSGRNSGPAAAAPNGPPRVDRNLGRRGDRPTSWVSEDIVAAIVEVPTLPQDLDVEGIRISLTRPATTSDIPAPPPAAVALSPRT